MLFWRQRVSEIPARGRVCQLSRPVHGSGHVHRRFPRRRLRLPQKAAGWRNGVARLRVVKTTQHFVCSLLVTHVCMRHRGSYIYDVSQKTKGLTYDQMPRNPTHIHHVPEKKLSRNVCVISSANLG